MSRRSKLKTISIWLLCFIGIPCIIVYGLQVLNIRQYGLFSMLIAILACVPFFLKYEKRKPQARELLLVSIMCALAISSRVLFAFAPAFKPITAIVILTGMAFGSEAGFMCGAMSALVSNVFFGQGPWTPFQMLSWGMIGFLAGILNKHNHLEHAVPLYIFGGISGVLYSLLMDVWSVLSIDGYFHLERYLAFIMTSLPFMVIYIVSNIIFLALIWKVMIRKLHRIRMKYGLINERGE